MKQRRTLNSPDTKWSEPQVKVFSLDEEQWSFLHFLPDLLQFCSSAAAKITQEMQTLGVCVCVCVCVCEYKVYVCVSD